MREDKHYVGNPAQILKASLVTKLLNTLYISNALKTTFYPYTT